MVIQQAILIELFAIFLVLFGWVSISTTATGEIPILIDIGFYVGFIGLLYGLVGSLVLSFAQSER